MVYYKIVKITVNVSGLAKDIINMVVHYHGLLDSIITNKSLFFTLKFCSSLCYFFGIKQRLFITFYPQTNSQIKQQNSIMEVYFQVFINFKQKNCTRLLSMAEFAYNNAKIANIG